MVTKISQLKYMEKLQHMFRLEIFTRYTPFTILKREMPNDLLYLGYNSVTVVSLTEAGIELDVDASNWNSLGKLSVLLRAKNAGRSGVGRVAERLLSIRTTEAMLGLSSTSSWTHSRPIWMLWITSFLAEEFPRIGSSNANGVPSLHIS